MTGRPHGRIALRTGWAPGIAQATAYAVPWGWAARASTSL